MIVVLMWSMLGWVILVLTRNEEETHRLYGRWMIGLMPLVVEMALFTLSGFWTGLWWPLYLYRLRRQRKLDAVVRALRPATLDDAFDEHVIRTWSAAMHAATKKTRKPKTP